MSTLSDRTLLRLLPVLVPEPTHREPSHVNAASLDVRIGATLEDELGNRHDLANAPYTVYPDQRVLVAVLERIIVPPNLRATLYLKSSMARMGWNHALAMWVDPGWDGILTAELKNENQRTPLELHYGMKFAQMVFDTLDQEAARPYAGQYQHATAVQAALGKRRK